MIPNLERQESDGDPDEASDIEEEPSVQVVQKIELTSADFYFGSMLGEDPGYLYMCMDFAPGGDLLGLITQNLTKKQQSQAVDECCDPSMTQFYVAEIIEAVEYLHGMHILHRDLKPENILIDVNGHIKITDFGTSSMGVDDGAARNSFVGTQDYVSPEVLSGEKAATKACDLWAVGCIIFQLLCGRSPFHAATEYLTFELIMGHCKGTHPLVFPAVISPVTQDIILGFLRVSDTDRLGAGEDSGSNGYPAVKNHAFFDGVLWGELVGQVAPYQPDSSKFPSTDNMRDGAADEWDLEGEPTTIDDSHHHQKHSSSGSNGSDKQSQGAGPKPVVSISGEFDQDRASTKWKRFLYEHEKQVFTGLIYKRKGMFSKKRQLILTDRPRLFYVDPDSMSFKGEIPWTYDFPVSCAIKNAKEFDVRCSKSGRSYHLLDSEAGSQIWVDLINAMLEKQGGTGRRSSGTAVIAPTAAATSEEA
eukprot:gene22708-28861_t